MPRAVPISASRTAEATADATSQGVRRPHRLRVRSDSAPPTGSTMTAVIDEARVSHARLVTLWTASICSTCAGSRTCWMPW